jgi:DNA-directed RNA polymerase specialized sigma24 family protein
MSCCPWFTRSCGSWPGRIGSPDGPIFSRQRRKQAARHGGGQVRVDIEAVEIACQVDDDELLAVHELLDKMAAEDPQKAELAKLRYFVGLPFEEAAEVLGISLRTAKRHWAYARAWLYEEMRAKRAT